MTAIATLRGRRLVAEVKARAEAYASVDVDVASTQLALLNRQWNLTITEVPFYRDLVAQGRLPDRFQSIAQYREVVPLTTRERVQQDGDRMSSSRAPADMYRVTGGTTAEPVQLPTWQAEHVHARSDMWLGRSWFGVEPSSRLFLLWGHSHQLGTGLSGAVQRVKRQIADRVLGYCRVSAYDLSPEALRRAADRLVDFRPDWMLGYSVALDMFARVNAERADLLRSAGLRLVVATSESFPDGGSEERLRSLLGCPVAMEYGAVETGVIAHTHPEGGYRVFWRTHLVELLEDDSIAVTSLHPRCFPLVRYHLSDEVVTDPSERSAPHGLTRLRDVRGRCNDYVELPGGERAHSELFAHVLRDIDGVLAYQVAARPGRCPEIHYMAADELGEQTRRRILERLVKTHAVLSGTDFRRVASLTRTVAGKTPLVLHPEKRP